MQKFGNHEAVHEHYHMSTIQSTWEKGCGGGENNTQLLAPFYWQCLRVNMGGMCVNKAQPRRISFYHDAFLWWRAFNMWQTVLSIWKLGRGRVTIHGGWWHPTGDTMKPSHKQYFTPFNPAVIFASCAQSSPPLTSSTVISDLLRLAAQVVVVRHGDHQEEHPTEEQHQGSIG